MKLDIICFECARENHLNLVKETINGKNHTFIIYGDYLEWGVCNYHTFPCTQCPDFEPKEEAE